MALQLASQWDAQVRERGPDIVTNAEEQEPVPGRVHVALDTSERIVREVVAGSPQGAVRRIVLYCIVMAGVTAAAGVTSVAVYLAVLAVVLLISTDRLI